MLNDTLGSEIDIVKYRSPEGLPARSIGLSVISGTNRSPGIGLRTSPTQTGMMERYRIQIDIFETDREQVEIYAE